MDHGGEAATPVGPAGHGIAGAVQGGEPHMRTGAQLGGPAAAAARRAGFDEFARHVHAAVGRVGGVDAGYDALPGGVDTAYDALHGGVDYSALQPRSGAGSAVVVAVPDLLTGGGGVYNGVYALQPRPGAGHGEVFVGLLLGAVDNRAGRGEVFIGPLPDGDGDGAVFDDSANLAPQTLLSTGRAGGINLGAENDGGSGALAQHLRRLIPFAGIGASSVAVNGLAAGPASPAAAFNLFVLLLGGLFLVVLHVLRV